MNTMNPLPNKLWLRWGDVVAYLESIGIKRKAALKLKQSGVLHPKTFPGQTRAFYDRDEVIKIKPDQQN